MKKILFIVFDGLGDEPIPEFGGRTPLEAARTPHLDHLCSQGACGLLKVDTEEKMPTSEGGHFALFGYDLRKYRLRRGAFTAQGAGIKMKKGDVALRGNFATLNEKMIIEDRRAGRINETKELVDSIKKIKIKGVKFIIKSAGEHRLGIVLRGKGLSPNISDGDPHYGQLGEPSPQKIAPLDSSFEARHTAEILNQFLESARKVLVDHLQNQKRRSQGLPAANYILLRGASALPQMTSFKQKYGLKAACVAGKPLYKQIAQSLGMKVVMVKGATGRADTDLKAKFDKANQLLKKYDFVFLHLKATDSLAEDGRYQKKSDFISRADVFFALFENLKKTLVIVTCDHSTCSLKKRHCDLDCPLMVWGGFKDEIACFGETFCAKGGLGRFPQKKLMKKVLEMAKE